MEGRKNLWGIGAVEIPFLQRFVVQFFWENRRGVNGKSFQSKIILGAHKYFKNFQSVSDDVILYFIDASSENKLHCPFL